MFNLILTFVAVFMPQVTTTLVTTGVLGDLVEELRGQSGDVLVPSDEVGAFFTANEVEKLLSRLEKSEVQ